MPKVHPKLLDFNWVNGKYWNEGLSCPAIASEIGVSASAVRRALIRLGVRRRTTSECTAGERNPMYNKGHSEETKKKLRERVFSEETRRKMSLSAIKKFEECPELREVLSRSASEKLGIKNPFYGKSHSLETRNTISKSNEGRFRGSKGSNWQGGKTSINFRIRQSAKYKRWQKQILERDDYRCQICSTRGGVLHVDHIKPFYLIINENNITFLHDADLCEELYDLDNGRVLCEPCHKQTDTYLWKAKKIKLNGL